MDAKIRDFYLIHAISKQKDNLPIMHKSNAGKHFLSQIKKLKDEMVFDKIKEIERKDGDKENEEIIKLEIEFF